MNLTYLETDLAPDAIDALQLAKSAFLGAEAERCGYLRVAFEPHPESGELAVAADFSLGKEREWHKVDASIKFSDLQRDPQPAARRVFADLSDGVRMIAIARHFRPMGGDEVSGAD